MGPQTRPSGLSNRLYISHGNVSSNTYAPGDFLSGRDVRYLVRIQFMINAVVVVMSSRPPWNCIKSVIKWLLMGVAGNNVPSAALNNVKTSIVSWWWLDFLVTSDARALYTLPRLSQGIWPSISDQHEAAESSPQSSQVLEQIRALRSLFHPSNNDVVIATQNC